MYVQIKCKHDNEERHHMSTYALLCIIGSPAILNHIIISSIQLIYHNTLALKREQTRSVRKLVIDCSRVRWQSLVEELQIARINSERLVRSASNKITMADII